MTELKVQGFASAETDSLHKTEVTNDSLDVGAFSKQVNESYVYFSLAALPEQAEVTGLSVTLRQKAGSYYKKSVQIRASVCSNYIAPEEVTWENKPEAGSISGRLGIAVNEEGERTWELTPSEGAEEGWGSAGGAILILKFEVEGAAAGDNNAKGFYPAEEAELTLCYTVPQGVKIFRNGGFAEKPVYVYSGGAWKKAVLRKYSGGAWLS